MEKTKQERCARVFAVNARCRDGFNIFVDIAGHREFVVHHRHNAPLYGLLHNGIHLNDLRRWKPKASQRQINRKLVNTISHLIKVVENHLRESAPNPATEERLPCGAADRRYREELAA